VKLKGALKYSQTCNAVNKTASDNVTINPLKTPLYLPAINPK
jgi:hypothetical protein